jgi:hypothetical protein
MGAGHEAPLRHAETRICCWSALRKTIWVAKRVQRPEQRLPNQSLEHAAFAGRLIADDDHLRQVDQFAQPFDILERQWLRKTILRSAVVRQTAQGMGRVGGDVDVGATLRIVDRSCW